MANIHHINLIRQEIYLLMREGKKKKEKGKKKPVQGSVLLQVMLGCCCKTQPWSLCGFAPSELESEGT